MLGSSSGGVFPEFVVLIYFVRFFLKKRSFTRGLVWRGHLWRVCRASRIVFCLSLSVLVKNSCMFFRSSNFVGATICACIFERPCSNVFCRHFCHLFLSILYELNSLLGLGSFWAAVFATEPAPCTAGLLKLSLLSLSVVVKNLSNVFSLLKFCVWATFCAGTL